MVARNSEGVVEISVALDVSQAHDVRTVLHKADVRKGDVEKKTAYDAAALKQYRAKRDAEEELRGEYSAEPNDVLLNRA